MIRELNDDQRELRMLKKLVIAQDKVINIFSGKTLFPKYYRNAISKAKDMFNVEFIADIK